MYISTWVIIIAVVVGIYFYSRSRNNGQNSRNRNESLSAKEMWERAESSMEKVLSKSPNLEKHLKDERDMIKAMDIDMARLRERFKHDPKKQLEIAHDWMDYSNAVEKVKFSREWLDVDMEEGAFDSHFERTKEANITIEEISKRVEEILGKESNSKIVSDRLRKKTEAVHEILSK